MYKEQKKTYINKSLLLYSQQSTPHTWPMPPQILQYCVFEPTFIKLHSSQATTNKGQHSNAKKLKEIDRKA